MPDEARKLLEEESTIQTFGNHINTKEHQLFEKSPSDAELIESTATVLENLQHDTIREFTLGFLNEDSNIYTLELSNEMYVFLLLSNTLNSLDRKIETATQSTTLNTPTSVGGNMLSAVLERGKSGRDTKGKRINPITMLTNITQLATKLGIQTEKWPDLMSEAIE